MDAEIVPQLDKTICLVIGGPIKWSRNDTSETVRQIEVLHNSQWEEFQCEELKR